MPWIITMFISSIFKCSAKDTCVGPMCRKKENLLENSAAPGFWLLAPLSLPTQQINQSILQDSGQVLVPDFSTLNISIAYVAMAWRKENETFLTLPQLYVFHMTLKNWNWQELSLDCTVSQLVCNTLYWLVSRWMLTAFCLRYTFPVCTFTDLSWTNVKVNFWVAQPYNGWRAKLQDTLRGKKTTNVGKEL